MIKYSPCKCGSKAVIIVKDGDNLCIKCRNSMTGTVKVSVLNKDESK